MSSIEGTVFEIIAKANKLTQVKDTVFVDHLGNRFILSKMGFLPVEIHENAFLIQLKNESDERYKSKIADLKYELDDLAHQLAEAKKVEVVVNREQSNPDKQLQNVLEDVRKSRSYHIFKNHLINKFLLPTYIEKYGVERYKELKTKCADIASGDYSQFETELIYTNLELILGIESDND